MTLRILATFIGGHGHLEPLLPIAAAAREAGHTVAFACSASMARAVEAAGYPVLDDPDSGPTPRAAEQDAVTGPSPSPLPTPLLAVDRRREERDLREKFAGEGARWEARVLRTAGAWRPDVIVCDEVDLGAVVAAELLGVPCATVVVLAAGGFLRPDVVASTLDGVRAEHGLEPDPGLVRARGGLVIDPTPPGYRDPADPLPDATVRVALLRPGRADATPRPWVPVRPAGPAIYVTLGTVFPLEAGDLLERVVAACSDHPGDALITVGPDIDPASLGSAPAHVHLERYVPQARILPHVALVVSHAGSGTVLATLAHGRPMVLLPMGADQPWNGDRCAAIGVGRVLDVVTASVADLRAAIRDGLADQGARRAAESCRAAMLELPGPAAAVAAIERLVQG